ncbi:hypothetical protein Tco_1479218 [Tanacetum coccineum]
MIAENHHEVEDQEGNNLLEIETLTYHVLATYRYFAFGRHLDKLHVTWAYSEKKRARLQTNTKTLKDLGSQSLETASQAIHDAVTPHPVTASHISRRRHPSPTQTWI